jgi:hypothetical protein
MAQRASAPPFMVLDFGDDEEEEEGDFVDPLEEIF